MDPAPPRRSMDLLPSQLKWKLYHAIKKKETERNKAQEQPLRDSDLEILSEELEIGRQSSNARPRMLERTFTIRNSPIVERRDILKKPSKRQSAPGDFMKDVTTVEPLEPIQMTEACSSADDAPRPFKRRLSLNYTQKSVDSMTGSFDDCDDVIKEKKMERNNVQQQSSMDSDLKIISEDLPMRRQSSQKPNARQRILERTFSIRNLPAVELKNPQKLSKRRSAPGVFLTGVTRVEPLESVQTIEAGDSANDAPRPFKRRLSQNYTQKSVDSIASSFDDCSKDAENVSLVKEVQLGNSAIMKAIDQNNHKRLKNAGDNRNFRSVDPLDQIMVDSQQPSVSKQTSSNHQLNPFGWLMKLAFNGPASTGNERLALWNPDSVLLQPDHLQIQELKGIQYSFYTSSPTENFGFIRFAPNVKKKRTKTRNFQLKFLVLQGELEFDVNKQRIEAKGGDFVMINNDTKYQIRNGEGISMLFMIKYNPSK